MMVNVLDLTKRLRKSNISGVKNLYDAEVFAEIQQRLNALEASTPAQWGTMNAAQMLAHCTVTLEIATGQRKIPRSIIYRIATPIIRKMYYNDRPFPKNIPTDTDLIVKGIRNFVEERIRIQAKIIQFYEAGEEGCPKEAHPFLGEITAKEWGISVYKHLDHHFRQFGI